MIRYIRHSEIDKELWDRKIAGSPQGEVYAFSWFLDIVSPGWEALVSDDYETVFPLTRRNKFGFDYLYQPFFTQQLGLFSSVSEIPDEEIRKFLDAIPSQFRFIEIQLNTANKITEAEGFQFIRRKTHLLGLLPDLIKLRSGYSENLKRNLKKTAAADSPLSFECPVKDVIRLFRDNKGKSVGNLSERDYSTFEKLMARAQEKNLLEVISVRDKRNTLLAAALFLKSVHSYIFIFSATSEDGKQAGAMIRIIDNFIERHRGEKMVLDFEGSMDENLARFYKSFGSQEVVYLQVRKNNLPLLIRWLK